MQTNFRPARVQIRVYTFEGALQPRVIGRAQLPANKGFLVMWLARGQAGLRIAPEPEKVVSDVLIWQPIDAAARVVLYPGSVGSYAIFDEEAFEHVFGTSGDAYLLRAIARKTILTPVADDKRLQDSVAHIFKGLSHWVGAATLTDVMLTATYLRLLLLEAARALNVTLLPAARGATPRQVFDGFKTYVDNHYRDRPKVERVAAALGVSADRLNDICQRERQASPKKLIDKRTVNEAIVLLQTSSLSIEQISEHLGFASASQFNGFFRRAMDAPPGRFRRDAAATEPEAQSLFDWP
jgi:AraC-like DNA-binding protein